MHIDRHDPRNSFAARIIEWSVHNSFFVVIASLSLMVAGILALKQTPLDAIPDLSETQVIIRTEWPGQAPQVIEDQVTFPLASQMLGLPRTRDVRGFSMFGDSFLYIVFEDGVDPYWARSRVLEALSQSAGRLPEGVTPQLGPDATGVGWVFQYALFDRTGRHDLSQLRSLQDWFVRYELATLDGVAEVASVGGFVKEFQVLADPNRLRAYDISLPRLIEAVRSANGETGGRTMEMAETRYIIRSRGYLQSVEDLQKTVLKTHNGTPVTIGDVASVRLGPSIREGITELDGMGEVVGGFVIMRPGANGLHVIDAVKSRIESIRKGLPEGVEIQIVYDRSELIRGSVEYLKGTLIEESLMVMAVTFAFLLHVRSAFVALITLPLGILAAFLIMVTQGITANIMSLGGIAIAIGAMIDASIVMVENGHRKLTALPEGSTASERRAVLIEAAKEVGPGVFFSLLIITVSFLPVFALNGQSARLFTPLAYTKTYAMGAASLLSVTIVPILMIWFLRGKIRQEHENPVNRFFMMLYRPILDLALKRRKATLLAGIILLISTSVPALRTGTEFMPPLYEGSLLYMPMTLPGVSADKAREILQVTNRQLMSFPEVEHAFGKAGRSDSATDPAPLAMIETWVELKPREAWRVGMTPEKLMDEMDAVVRLPGMMNSWNYPIRTRIEMLTTGIRTPVGVKITGPDLQTIDSVAVEVEQIARTVPGTRSAIADRAQGAKYIEIVPDRDRIARYGVDIGMVQMVIQTALGGMMLDQTVQGRERYPVILRYDRAFRDTAVDLENILVPGEDGMHVPLADLASIRVSDGPAMVRSEDARLTGFVFVDIKGRDIGSYIKDLRVALSSISLPAGVSIKFSGQFEQMQEANERLAVALPLTLLIVVTLLYLHFGRWDRTLLILLSLPFGLIGGFWSVWLAGYNMSVAVAVGFIALAGIAVETAIIMLIYIDQQMREHPPEKFDDLLENVKHGAVQRLRPKLMTVGTVILGLVPIFLSEGPGSDVMRRIALPLLGGTVSTLALTLILVPVVYAVYYGRGLKKQD